MSKEHLTPFKKGSKRASEAGKKSKRGKSLSTVIKDVIKEGKIDSEEFILNLYQQAMDGNSAIAKLLIEYESGKVTDKVEMTGADGEPIKTVSKIEIEFVKAKTKTTRKAK